MNELSEDEKFLILKTRAEASYKMPPFVKFTIVYNFILLVIAIGCMIGGYPEQRDGISFWWGAFSLSTLLSVILGIREKENYIDNQLRKEDTK